ncbi:hypothetical protein BEWA_027770 [Theileria equi strain WA]|uniref:Signal peptide containing protein n=1 Tax=Theileria equi strain WA TaxID=1537102 RepID=L0AXH2_THEEQ|nr:hypothetical protein BEWA_027770 [Theileria equi strain WA]AFZ79928.1 hypothetical protein BEWA_027770 [Theileria equi strain WA]|eukprot:XP_004829594.1 hypothetical protein BEWA_027770 [Theileria equi strain WA]
MSRKKQELRFLFILGTKSLQDGRNMTILVIFYALFLSIVCSSTDSRDGGSNGYTEPLVSKIDGSKYNVSVSKSNGVPILKLEAKEGMVVTELKYGGETIWDGDGEVEILSTLIYFSDDRPEVVTLKCRENGRDRTLILHKDGKKWKESKEEHERKLKELQVTKKHVEVKAQEAKTAAKEITVVATTEAVFTSTNSAGNAFRKKTVSGDIQVGNDLVGDTSRGARVEDEESTEHSPSLGDNDDSGTEEPETTEENEVKDNEPEEPKEEASIEALLDLPEHIPEHPQEFEDEDEDPEPNDDGFWDTPDDYSERQDDTQDEPDGLVIDDEDPSEDHEDEAEEAYEDDSLKSAPETSTKSRTRSEEGTIGGLERGHPKEPEDNDLGEEDEDEAEESENSSSSPVSMDIADLDSQNYKHVDYIYDDNHIRLFLPNEGMIIAKLIDGENSIWEAKSDEKFEFAKVYLNKDGKAEVMLVTKNTPSGVERKYYTKTWTGWRESKDIGDRVPKLKVSAQQKSDFNIDLSLETSTKECTIFEAELLGVTTKHIFPKPGYIAKEVMSNGVTVWNSANGNERCIGCELYLRGRGHLLLAVAIKGRTKEYKFFEKEGSRWVPVKNEEFSEKFEREDNARILFMDFYETNEPEGQDMNVPEPQGGEAEEEEDEPPSQEVNMTRNISTSTGSSSDRVDASPSEVDRLPNSSREVKRKITKDREVKDIPVEVENYTIRRKTSTPTIHKETEETIRAQRVPANHVNNNAQMQKNINCRETSNYNEDKNIQHKQAIVSNSQNFDVNRINCIGSCEQWLQESLEGYEGETEGEMKIKTSRGTPLPAPRLAGQVDSTLNLASPDNSKLELVESSACGVSYRGLRPKGAFHISSVMDGQVSVWTANGDQKYTCVEYYEKDGVTILRLKISDGSDTMPKYFEKVDGEWESITEDDYDKKIEEMMGESGKNVSLNISHPNRLLCKSFDYNFAGNAVQLIVPNKGISVSKLMYENGTVWTPGYDEEFGYAKTYLNKEGKAELVSVTLKTSSGILRRDYMKGYSGWTSCSNTEERMRSLRTSTTFKSNFTMDIALANSTKECSVFEVDLLGITIRHFFPKPGYVAEKVKDRNISLWERGQFEVIGGSSDRCLFCLIYKNGDKELVEMILLENLSERGRYLEKVDRRWAKITRGEFDKKYYELRRLSTPPAPQATNTPVAQSAGQYNFDSRVKNSQRSDKYRNTDNLESESGLTDAAGALRGGNQYIAYDTDTMYMNREKEFWGKMDYTDSRDLFNAQPYLEYGPMEQIYAEPRGNFARYPSNLMIPDKDSCTRCAMERMITPIFFPEFQSDTVINVSKYNPTFYNIYDYYFDDIITRLIVPWYWTEITSLSHGGKAIWIAQEGESLVYATVHLRDTMPILAYILKNSPSANKSETILRTNHGWRLIGNYPGAFKSIPRPNVVKFHCTIDLTCPDHGRVKVFDTVLEGLKTRFFIPRLGFRAYKIIHNGAVIWRSPEYEYSGRKSQWRAILVRAYLRGNSCFLVKATLKETGDSLSSINYIYLNGRWIEIDERQSERTKWALKACGDSQEIPTRHF